MYGLACSLDGLVVSPNIRGSTSQMEKRAGTVNPAGEPLGNPLAKTLKSPNPKNDVCDTPGTNE